MKTHRTHTPHHNHLLISSALRVFRVLSPLFILLLISQHSGAILPAHAVIIVKTSGSKSEGESEGDSGLGDAAGNLASNMVQSWQWALIVMAIFGEIFAVVLGLGSIRALIVYTQKKGETRRRLERAQQKINNGNSTGWVPPDQSPWNTSGAFCFFAFIALCSLAAYYPLFVIQQLMQAQVISLSNNSFKTWVLMNGLANLTKRLADVGVACAILALLRRRWTVYFPNFASRRPATGQSDYSQGWLYNNWKRGFDSLIVLLMGIFASAIGALECLEGTYTNWGRFNATMDFVHVYCALYYVVTIDIIVSVFLLRGALVKAGIKDELVMKTLCMTVSLFLGAEAIFELVVEIITSLPQTTDNINYKALAIAEVSVIFICYSYALLPVLRGFLEPGESFLSCGSPRAAGVIRR